MRYHNGWFAFHACTDILISRKCHSGKSPSYYSDCRSADFTDFPDLFACIYRLQTVKAAAQYSRSIRNDRSVQFL